MGLESLLLQCFSASEIRFLPDLSLKKLCFLHAIEIKAIKMDVVEAGVQLKVMTFTDFFKCCI